MTLSTGKQMTAIHILLNISRRKGSQTMKFGQLIDYNMRNIFLKNHAKNVVEKLVPDPFVKNQSSTHLWINSLKLYTVSFHCMFKLRTNLKLRYCPVDDTAYKAFLFSLFFIIFEKKYFLHHILLTDQISLSDCLYFLRS